MTPSLPDWLDAAPWLAAAATADASEVMAAIASDTPGERQLAALLSPAGAALLEPMARRAQTLTRRHFGRTISLYVPLYLSDYCSGGCAYCGFASDRPRPRRKLDLGQVREEVSALKRLGFDDVLLLTGERTAQADFPYLRECVAAAAEIVAAVAVEAFPMTVAEYRQLAAAGCTGVTIYQETYDPVAYDALHRWGPKRDFAARLDAPSRALEAGIRTVGLGALLGLADPIRDALCLYRHALRLSRTHWRGGLSISFPRVRAQSGGFAAPRPVSEALLARIVFAFRICLPETPLVLSTREGPRFRDGIAGIGISKMSAASRTTVGGYRSGTTARDGQFEVGDTRDVESFRDALRGKRLEPVFKNWDRTYR
jgi:2-iminoacetate synthase